MLSGVVLHEIKAAIPIDGPVYTAADIQRAVTGVDHSPIPFMHLQNFDRAKGAQVIRLTAALRVESGLIQQNIVSFFALYTAFDYGRKVGQILIFFVKLLHLFHLGYK